MHDLPYFSEVLRYIVLANCWCLALVNNTSQARLMAQAPIRLDDVTVNSGVDFVHFSGRSGKHYIIETVTAGLATLDFDSDGWIDIFLLSGSPLPGYQPGDKQDTLARPSARLYRNVRGMRFEDVSQAAHTAESGFALGVAAGDYDNDGDTDLFISNYGPAVMLINNGDGTFDRRVLEQSSAEPRVGAGLSLLDANKDGILDIYMARYIVFSYDKGVSRTLFGIPAAPGPKDYDPDYHTLLLGNSEDSSGFRDGSMQADIGRQAGPGMGTVAFDYDNDRDTDIFVCNDSAANFLWTNQGASRFEETAILSGVAYDVTGSQQATMGADVADFDGDGWLDLITTSFIDELPMLARNSGKGYFDDIAASAGLGSAARNVTWGVGFSDFDNDTWPDLYIASGHLIPGSSKINDTEKFAAPNLLFRNLGGKRFQNIGGLSGSALKAVQVSRGIAIDDLDNDGRTDIVVLNLDDHPQLIHNVSMPANHWQCQLVGISDCRDGVGARVTVTVGQRRIVQEVIAGRGYQSHFGQRLHFGLGTAEQVDRVEIDWLDGAHQTLGPFPAGGRWLLRQHDQKAIQLP